MTDSNPPKSTKPASPFDSLLAQCRDLVSERLSKAMDVMLDKVDETLSDLIFDSPDRDMRALYLETRDKALAQRETIAQQFRAQYLREFQVRSNRVKKIGQSFSDVDASFAELNLVGEDDLNETLKLNDMATKLRQYCDDELLALDQRVGVLLGDANLEAEDNPFSPHAICEAFKNTSRSFESNVKVRMVLLKLFDDHVLDDIRSVYKAVNALLVQNSILPKIRYGGVSRGKEDGKSPPAATPAAVPAAAERSPSDGPDFFSVLQDLLASGAKAAVQPGATGGSAPGVVANPAAPGGSAPGVASNPAAPGVGGAGGAPMVVLQGAELMGFLTRMQHGDAKAAAEAGLPAPDSGGERDSMANILRELKGTSFSNGMNQMDVMTLDIVAMLFDQLFDDPKIPIAVKGLIGRMQIPMLKVAIADKAFFSKKSHPARRLLDTLGEISSRLPGEFNASNPLFGRLEGIIQELMNNFQDNMEIFDVVRERLQNLVEEEDQRSEEQTQAAAKRIELDERLAASKTMAEYEVKTRVEAGNLPRPVIEFLVHQWIKPLLIVHVRRGQHSDAWKNSLATMDLLIWSVEAKHTPEERSKLATVVPDLLKRLAAGLTIADIEDAIRERFFSDLNKLHTEAMGMGEGGKIAAAPDDSGETGAAKPDIEFAVTPRPEPEETVQTIPITAIEVPDLSQIQLLDPKETVQPTPAVATGPLELPQIHLPEPKVTVQPTQAVANEPLELSPVHLPEPKETAEPTPAPATEPLELPPIHFPEPKETVQPIPAATSHAPATPKIPVPAPSQAPKPMSPSAGHAPVPPKIPVPDLRQPVRPTPQTAAPASSPPRPSVQVTAQPVRPTPQKAAPVPTPPRPSAGGPRRMIAAMFLSNRTSLKVCAR